MSKTLASLNIKIGADINRLNSGLKKAQKSLRKFQRSTGQIGSAINKSITLPLLGIGAVSLRAFDKQAQAIAQVEAGLKSTGGTVGRTSEQLQQMAADLQGITTFGDEDIMKNVTAQLLTFTNIAGDQFEKTQMAALNLATRMDGDLKGATLQLGKALNDPVKNLSALSRSGIQFSEDQIKVIKSLQETGQAAEAQTIILAELEKQFGGSAEAAAKAGLGPMIQLKNSLGDIAETIGELVLPYVTKIAAKIKSFAERINNLSDSQKKNIIQIAGWAAGIGIAFTAASKLAGAISTIIKIGQLLLTANPIGLALAAIVIGFKLAYDHSERFRAGISGIGAIAKELFSIIKESVSGFVQGFAALSRGEFVNAGKHFKDGLIKSNPIGIALTQGERLGDAYMDAYKSKIESEAQKEIIIEPNVSAIGGPSQLGLGGIPDIPGSSPVSSPVDNGAVQTSAGIFKELAENIRIAKLESMALGETFGDYKSDQINLVKTAIGEMALIGDQSGLNQLSEQYRALNESVAGLPVTMIAAGGSMEILKDKTLEATNTLIENIPLVRVKLEEVTPVMEYLRGVGEELSSSLITSFNQLAESGSASFKKLGESALAGAAKVIRAKIAEGVASAISGTLKTFGASGPLALALGAAAGAGASALFSSVLGGLGVPAFADGGQYQGGLALVGERGPELINFNKPGYVHTNKELMDSLNSGSSGTHLVTADSKVRGEDIYISLRNYMKQNSIDAI